MRKYLIGLCMAVVALSGCNSNDSTACDPTVYADGTPAPCIPGWNE